MASEIAREKVLANFKPSRVMRLKSKASAASKREGNSEAYLAQVRKLPCVCCLRMPAGEAHHLQQGTGTRGMQMKSLDRQTIPLCRVHHSELHSAGSKNERAFLNYFGIEPLDLAAALWNARGDYGAMLRIVHANHGRKG